MIPPDRSPLRATYRVQLHAGFTFDDARAIVPYLARLGISHLYCSPVLEAMPGSTHGYDVLDHGRVSSELGGEGGFARLTDALREHGMGLVLDIVPNHMAIGERNRWWWDVLRHGRESRHAFRFDIDWDPPEARLRDIILLPLLADHYGRVLEAGEIRLVRDGDELVVAYGGHRFPLDPGTLGELASADDARIAELNADADRLDELLSAQHWRLASWRAASRDLGYRRFFDVDGLIGLRMEEPELFDDTHALILEWVAAGRVDGLRIDHPDGLGDPAVLGSDLNRLTSLFVRVCEANRRHRDFTRHELHHVLREMAAALPVYRTYVRPEDPIGDDDVGLIGAAVARAAERRPELDAELFAFLGSILRLEVPGPLATELAMRFQQLTPAAMAKGVEDTAFYRHHRLSALNEVGGDPGRFGTGADEFHDAMVAAQEAWPLAMLALSTHDTKRSADVRARLALISEDPDGWRASIERMTAASAPHRAGPERPTAADAYLFFQAVVGAWPIDADRATAYMEKASREAKLRTSWTAPQRAYDDALAAFVRGSLADPAFVSVVEATVEPLVDAGRRAALAQVALQLTAPGIPDLYQGSELWDLALVDPDNRRPVDYELRRRLLSEVEPMTAGQAWERRGEGFPKLWLIHRALEIRRRRPDAFGPNGGYAAIRPRGGLASAVVAFARGNEVVTVAPRLPRRVARSGWGDTVVELPPGRWRGLDGREHAGAAPARELLDAFPVAILELAQ